MTMPSECPTNHKAPDGMPWSAYNEYVNLNNARDDGKIVGLRCDFEFCPDCGEPL